MNAQAKSPNEYQKKIATAVQNYKGASKPLVSLFLEAVDHYWKNSQSADKISNFINGVADLKRLHPKAKALFVQMAPIAWDEDAETKELTAKNSEAWNKLKSSQTPEDKKKRTAKEGEYKAFIELFRAADLVSILDFEKEPKAKAPYNLTKATQKTVNQIEKFAIQAVEERKFPNKVAAIDSIIAALTLLRTQEQGALDAANTKEPEAESPKDQAA
ncbi:hypothetical protein OL383_004427 [Salmonella enterica]|nr:hypothetical protein [Salmonella enterica]